jgi:serine/threonine protein kinase
MSPEQAEGKTIDSRSDLFSLGIILYEMATGQRPLLATSISIVASIIRDTPPAVTELNARCRATWIALFVGADHDPSAGIRRPKTCGTTSRS